MNKALLTISIATMLTCSACSTARQAPPPLPAVEVKEIPAKPPLPQPSPVTTQPVKWRILKKGTPALEDVFTLTQSEFKKLTDNETEFLRWIKEATAQFAYYTEPPKSDVRSASSDPAKGVKP